VLARQSLPRSGTGKLLDLAERSARVWQHLPADDSTTLLTVLAASALDDPHALDRVTPTAAAALRLLGDDMPSDAEGWRATWEEHGVVYDPVSSRVLALDLRLTGEAACARLAAAAGPVG
jgi:hypothetical protein